MASSLRLCLHPEPVLQAFNLPSAGLIPEAAGDEQQGAHTMWIRWTGDNPVSWCDGGWGGEETQCLMSTSSLRTASAT